MMHSVNASVAGPGLVTLANAFNAATRMPEVQAVEVAYGRQSKILKALSSLRRMLSYKAPAGSAGFGLMNSVIRTATIGEDRK